MVHLGVLLHLVHQLCRTLRVLTFPDVRLGDPARRRHPNEVLLLAVIFEIILVIVGILFLTFLAVVFFTAVAKFTIILRLRLLLFALITVQQLR